MNEEQHWVHRAKAGDTAAFEQLVLAQEKRIYRLALQLCGNASDAEEVVQEAFLSAWKALPSFREESSFSTWLYRLTVNAAMTLLRGRRDTVSLSEEESWEIPDQRALPETETERLEQQEAVRAALGELPEELRTVLVLREVEQLSYQEMAGILQTAEGTVKSRLYRAREHLRKILLKQGTFYHYTASNRQDTGKEGTTK